MTEDHVVTLERHIVEEERRRPEATGAFSNILYALTLAAKIISREVNKAGIVDLLGGAGTVNVQGERVQKLDLYAQDVIYRAMDHTGALCCMVSEESEDILPIPAEFPTGEYVLIFDPLDGSSNIDVNVSIGTIFSIHRKISDGDAGTLEDCLQPGCRQVAAGYVVYSSSTVLAYTTGEGVHMFTLDPTVGAYRLSRENVAMPSHGKTYSINEAYHAQFPQGIRDYLHWTKSDDAGYSLRYIGSLVADFHRTLLTGGVFLYPPTKKAPDGKLRLLYEANPLAMLAEQAGGVATDGRKRILDKVPQRLHERTPLIIGSKVEVDRVLSFYHP